MKNRHRIAMSLGLGLVVVGCGPSPVGGWHSTTPTSLYACFHSNGTFGIEDSAQKAIAAGGTWTKAGKFSAPGPVSGGWSLSGNNLLLTLDPPCSSSSTASDFCGPLTLPHDDTFG